MTDFKNWCTPAEITLVNGHTTAVLVSTNDEIGVEIVASALPEKYATAEKLAMVADVLGKTKVADFLRNKLPTKASSRSGDLGEILATSYIEEEFGFTVGPSRLIDRDHQEWAMRGDDVLGAKVDGASHVQLVKVEAKSRKKMTSQVVGQARAGLERVGGLPSPHSLTQFADRLLGTSDQLLGESILRLQLVDDIRPKDVTHVMFLFTMNDPNLHVKEDLASYKGPISQQSITLRVSGHQEFIRNAYEKVLTDAP